MVCLEAGLMISSVAGSALVNSCSPSLLSPPYCAGTCSGAMYLNFHNIHKSEFAQSKQYAELKFTRQEVKRGKLEY